jgi:hypothetical protein
MGRMLMGWSRRVAAFLIHETGGGAIPNMALLAGLALLTWGTVLGLGLSVMYWLTSCVDCAARW